MSWVDLSKELSSKGLKSHFNKELKPKNIQGIYKKGIQRLERMNFEPIIKRNMKVEYYGLEE